MAKTSGLGWTTLSLADASGTAQDIRTDISNLKISTPRAMWDVTGIDKSAFERLPLLADLSVTLDGYFDPSANLAHAVLSSASSTSVMRALTQTVAGKSLNANVWITDYQTTRATGGALTWEAPLVLADGNVPTWS